MAKVNASRLNSANVKYDNSVDTERVYDIEANVNINGGLVVSFDGGSVKKDGVSMASFSYYGDNRKNVNFQGISEEEECEVLSAINAFVSDVKSAVVESPINL